MPLRSCCLTRGGRLFAWICAAAPHEALACVPRGGHAEAHRDRRRRQAVRSALEPCASLHDAGRWGGCCRCDCCPVPQPVLAGEPAGSTHAARGPGLGLRDDSVERYGCRLCAHTGCSLGKARFTCSRGHSPSRLCGCSGVPSTTSGSLRRCPVTPSVMSTRDTFSASPVIWLFIANLVIFYHCDHIVITSRSLGWHQLYPSP